VALSWPGQLSLRAADRARNTREANRRRQAQPAAPRAVNRVWPL
jgi:hypothetical protein